MSTYKPLISSLVLSYLFLFSTAFANDEASVEARINKVIKKAESYMGTPHKMGGMSKRGIDCSALMVVSFSAGNIRLPRTSHEQAKVGKRIARKDLRKGDLIFFKINGTKISHTGLVTKRIGNDVEFIHTSSSRGVMKSLLNQKYWLKRYTSARRVWNGSKRDKMERETSPIVSSPPSKAPRTNRLEIGKFPQASSRDLKKRELKRMSVDQLTMMSMEIYARNGYLFPTPKAQRYFENQEWYQRIGDKTSKRRKIKRRLSPIEKSNLKKIERVRVKKAGK